MSRCKACDVILTEHELKKKDRITGLFLDLCGTCIDISDEAVQDFWTEDNKDCIMLETM